MNKQSSPLFPWFLLGAGLAVTVAIAMVVSNKEQSSTTRPVHQQNESKRVDYRVIVGDHPDSPPVPHTSGRDFLGNKLALEDEEAIEYAKKDGVIVATTLHGVPAIGPDSRFDALLKEGQRAIVYRRFSEPRRQVIEFMDRKADDIDRRLVDKLAYDGFEPHGEPVELKNSVVFEFLPIPSTRSVLR